MEAVTIFLRAHTASVQLKSPDTCVAPVASVKNGLTHQKICASSKKNTALLNHSRRTRALQRTASGSALLRLQPPLSWVCFCWEPLAEERPYWEEYFDLVRVQDAHSRRKCRDLDGSEPWACCDCDCTEKLEERMEGWGRPFLEVLRSVAATD